MPANAEGQPLEIAGSDFGLSSSDVNITIGNRACLDGSLSLKSRLADATLKCNSQRETVGPREVVVTVAEQTTTGTCTLNPKP